MSVLAMVKRITVSHEPNRHRHGLTISNYGLHGGSWGCYATTTRFDPVELRKAENGYRIGKAPINGDEAIEVAWR